MMLLIPYIITVLCGFKTATAQQADADSVALDDAQSEELSIAPLTMIQDTIRGNDADSALAPPASPEPQQTTDSIVHDDLQKSDSSLSVDTPPEVLSFVKATYPDSLVKKGVEGAVLLDLLVNDSGRVAGAAIVRSLHPGLDTHAVEAARRFVFKPAYAGGKPVPVLMQYEYRFSLQEIVEQVERYVNFKGQLLEKGTRAPLRNAMVVLAFPDTAADTAIRVPFDLYRKQLARFAGQYCEEDRLVTLTDSMGNFSFTSLPVGPILISVPATEYEEFNRKEEIRRGEALSAKYYLAKLSYNDYEIVVYGKKEEKEVAREQLTMTEVKRIPGFSGDAIKVLQALPGVARPSFISGEVIVRGSPSMDSKYFLEGVQLDDLYHFFGIKSIYNSDALEKIDFYPGGYSVRYGNCIAGSVEITGRQARTDRWHGKVDMSALDGTLFVEGPVNEKLSLTGSVRRSFFGEIIRAAIKKKVFDVPAMILPYYWDYLLRADFALNDKHKLFATGFGYKDSISVTVKSFQGGSAEINSRTNSFSGGGGVHMGIFGWDFHHSAALKNTVRYQIYPGSFGFSVFGFATVRADALTHYIRDELRYRWSDKLTAVAGVNMAYTNMDFAMSMLGANNKIQRDTVKDWIFGDYAGYAMLEWKPVPALLIVPGIRYDYFPELDYHGSVIPAFFKYHRFRNDRGLSGEPSLRINTRYTLTQKDLLKAAAGNYSQTPQPMGQVIMKTWGDPKTPATKASQYVLGYERTITDLIHADIQTYYNYQWDIPRPSDEADLEVNKNTKPFVHDMKARMGGLELMLRHNQSPRFFGWIAYTLSRSQRLNHITKKYELYNKDQTHNLQVVGSWKLPYNMDAGFRFRFCSGDPDTPLLGKILDDNNDYFIPIWGKKNSIRHDPYVQLDIRVDRKVVYKKWIYSYYLDVQNIGYFVYKSPESTAWDPFYSEKTSMHMPFIPSIGLTMEF